jgi:hypothetical protein
MTINLHHKRKFTFDELIFSIFFELTILNRIFSLCNDYFFLLFFKYEEMLDLTCIFSNSFEVLYIWEKGFVTQHEFLHFIY